MFGTLDDVEDAVEKLIASEDPADPQRVARLLNRLEFVFCRSVHEVERRGGWAAEGFANAAAWVRERSNLSHGSAMSALKNGRTVASMPRLVEAFSSGEVTKEHVRTITRAMTSEREAALVDLDAELADAAKIASAKELRAIVQYVTDALDGDGGAAADDRIRNRRYLHLSPILDGFVINGFVDRECGQRLHSAFKAYMDATRRPGDPRTTPQRRADALVDLVECGVANVEVGPGRKARPEFLIVHDLEVLDERAPIAVKRVRADAEHAGRLSIATIDRLACDADIARVIMDGPSQVLDVGRKTRTIPPALYRALVVRDGGCVEPGCDRPPGWCEVHHRKPWQLGGATNLANTELRCRRHHIDEHNRILRR